MLCFLVDYKDSKGDDWHRGLQVGTSNKYLALSFIIQEVSDWNCTLSAVRLIHGYYTCDELTDLGETTDIPSHELLYINPLA